MLHVYISVVLGLILTKIGGRVKGDPINLFKGFIFERSRSFGLKVKVIGSNVTFLCLGGPYVDLNQSWWKGGG